jgi:small subunit ribosomal protein S4
MRYTGPKNKIARREKLDLGFKTLGSKAHATLLRKINIGPGQHGAKTRRKVSERARQLREKQKLRYMFGVSEKQLGNYFAKAIRQKGNTAENLVRLLEHRLDNVVFRLGLAPTRAAARQLVNHRHVTVNGKIVGIPSYHTVSNDVVTFKRAETRKIPAVETAMGREDFVVPAWLERQADTGRVTLEPTVEDVEKNVNLRLVIEFYSK